MKDIILLADSLESIVRMPDADAGSLIKALALDDEGRLTDIASISYPLIKGQVDRMYAFREKQARNGAKGGRPKKPNENPNETQKNPDKTQPKAPVPVPVPVPEPIKDKRFTPPTSEEVSAYALENGIRIDAQRFVDYYTAVGWKVGGKTPMKDWKAAVRNWAARDKAEKQEKKTDYMSKLLSVDYGELLRRRG